MLTPISTDRLTLRLLEEDDRDAFVAAWTASLALYIPWLPNVSKSEDLDARFDLELAKAHRGANQGTHARYVGFAESGEIAGFFNLNDMVRGCFFNAFLGYSGNVALSRQGFVTEGVRALVQAAFDVHGLHRVQANIIKTNLPSIRIAERVGFRHEGTAKRYLHIGGAWQDHEMYAITREERA